jgi:hypothetical protein
MHLPRHREHRLSRRCRPSHAKLRSTIQVNDLERSLLPLDDPEFVAVTPQQLLRELLALVAGVSDDGCRGQLRSDGMTARSSYEPMSTGNSTTDPLRLSPLPATHSCEQTLLPVILPIDLHQGDRPTAYLSSVSRRGRMDYVYRVAFFKRLTDSTGHPVSPCQGAVEVRASSEARAIELARLRFAELSGVSVWSLRADYEKVELLSTRKRVSNLVWRRSLQDESSHVE